MKDQVSNLLIRYLEGRGVKHIFGLCGHTNIAVLSAMSNSKINFVTVRHEQIAAHAADGYARVTGKASVLLSHLSPGLTNAATGVANAALDCIPMVVIAGDVPSHYYGKHPHQEVNLHADASQFEIYRPFVKRAWRVDTPELFPEIIEKAFALAENGQPGPVLVDVPMDIFSAEIDVALFDRLRHNTKTLSKPSIDEETAATIVRSLVEADNPLLYVGGGIALAKATGELEEFVDHLNIPVAHSLMGKGMMSDEHPMMLGMTGFWGTQFINDQCLKADWVLGLGTRFKEADCSSWYPDYTFNFPPAKLIHIDIEATEIGRNFPTEIGVVADLKQALKVMLKVARELYPKGLKNPVLAAEIAAYRLDFKASNAEMESSDAFPMMPERILADVRAAMPRDAILTTDVGWNKNGVGQQFPIYTPATVFTPGGYATMGFGPPAALGIKIACPDKVVISMVGDGGFGQNPALLATAAAERLGVIWVVMNNNAFGTIAGLQKAHYGLTYGTTFPDDGDEMMPNYADIAKAYGVDGVRVRSAKAFKPALEAAIASGRPTVIDVAMINNPTPTSGHWNILDIYSPNKDVSHVAT
ncbi:MAG: thiamine pyrophosphate-binding protein [Rhodospirillaceae bacterium]|jgi:acetolactate synthase I/II/III large subunit|nr:thiamine pyrophosphate-binding protein [Rhodospirillaceae bacterium]MBT5243180.1 thiamine pyrophosphate-binding protein [Rhodospirillaceae bacterium]MBT5563405.1 thiamine pyrophosphate-binding protein [Rhodospirillaceae bacterium]MBT6243719.1 thiamine pyrophosphate-binding protein [Rhodospirillaceae bacterium]MBT7942840.1 thiamine pyrophosphate-binding protein [Alphaproteobacteria bacterium]